jgi:cytoskeletal protein CcmA (bactofilin family)
MFGKKKSGDASTQKSDDAKSTSASGASSDDKDPGAAPPLKPFSRKGTHAPPKPPTATSFQPETPRRVSDIPGPSSRRMDRVIPGSMPGAMSSESDSKRLIVGREICLKGEITACDKLVVEGVVEVTLSNARAIEVAPSGHFTGDADVAEADISGRFDGELIAREKLIVRAGGHVNGKVRYGRIVIESGGEVSGDMQSLEAGKPGED